MIKPMILDGKALADKICAELKERVDKLKEQYDPKLIIVTSGDDAASKIYVRNKLRRADEIGIEAEIIHHDFLLFDNATEAASSYHPIIFQLPITGDVSIEDLTFSLDGHAYDVDGFVSDYNIRMLATGGKPAHYPCTPKGIMRLLSEYKIDVAGKGVCIIGRSNIVGRPLARMMEQAGATVTLCHSKTPEWLLYRCIENADIVVSATGVRNVVTYQGMLEHGVARDWNNDGRGCMWDKILIDVGINRDENGKLCGDFDPELLEHCAAYTPVPGGVGPMTVAMLMENVVEFYES